ncbi:hypothetical protein [Nocardioides sp. Soil805]|uniref:hypothetical protein n=1 Tax=Nocardioides sp. Soil805 TaxID=1736416 RepID=UPI000702C393|nr:hypothetical protein [Nocardioides sp. Soil805]KRF35981.1 hypothetical protein ASG94_00310 [Nocardioides sp. Soil805]
MRRTLLPVAALVLGLTAAGCSSEQETYCQAVEEHQPELTDIAASAEPGAVLDALDAYRDLREQAPDDLRDEWTQVVTRLEALRGALDDAGVDPASYDPKVTPEELAQDDRRAVESAARALGETATIKAMGGIEQQALDVCGTPLSQ